MALTPITAAAVTYRFFFRNFRQLAKLILAPLAATCAVLYACLWAYLSELIAFITTGDGRAASIALGALAACIFLCIFFAAIAVSSVANLILRNRRPQGIRLRATRQEWRLYAAYLRFLLLLSGFVSTVYLVSTLVLRLVGLGRTAVEIFAISAVVTGSYVLFAWIGFVIPPIVVGSTGTVLRKALIIGSRDFRRNLVLVLLLSVPGFAIQIAGEMLFKVGTGSLGRVKLDLPITSYASAVESRLLEFAPLFTLSLFITIVLFSACSLVCYTHMSESTSCASRT